MTMSLSNDLIAFKWSAFHPIASLRRVPALLICVIAGLCLNQPTYGVIATGAALGVGMAGFRQVRGSRFLCMMASVVSMSVSAVVGSLAGNSPFAAVLVTSLWGFACGLLTVLGEDIGWVVMQGVIALVVATAFPSYSFDAAARAVFIMAGASVQIPCLLMLWAAAGLSWTGPEFPNPETKPTPLTPYSVLWANFLASWQPNTVAFTYAARVGLTMAVAIELDHLLRLQNGYWLPMTTIIILKPDFYRTYAGGIERVVGTLVGVAAATLIAILLHPHHYILTAMVALFGFLAYGFLKTNSVAFSASLTALMVFLIALSGYPEMTVGWHRFTNTFLGSALALFSRFVGFNYLLPLLHRVSPREIHN
jgi:hypothetical protein